ncbi:RNA-directed DNA polymerase, eukaryota, reverse transcriptase zinc-binding domain protein [Tanacetum coccineum]
MEWDWGKDIRGRVSKELEDLLGVLQHVVVSNNCRDRWSWSLGEDGEFTVKELSRLIEEKILMSVNGDHETLWNKLVPKKVNIFVWRALRGRLPVRVELDRRGIDLDVRSIVQVVKSVVETCGTMLDPLVIFWRRVCGIRFSSDGRWGLLMLTPFDEFFASNGNVNVPIYHTIVWQAVIWTIGYFIWKERNAYVFGKIWFLALTKLFKIFNLKASNGS